MPTRHEPALRLYSIQGRVSSYEERDIPKTVSHSTSTATTPSPSPHGNSSAPAASTTVRTQTSTTTYEVYSHTEISFLLKLDPADPLAARQSSAAFEMTLAAKSPNLDGKAVTVIAAKERSSGKFFASELKCHDLELVQRSNQDYLTEDAPEKPSTLWLTAASVALVLFLAGLALYAWQYFEVINSSATTFFSVAGAALLAAIVLVVLLVMRSSKLSEYQAVIDRRRLFEQV